MADTNIIPDAHQLMDQIDKFANFLETIYARDTDFSRKAALNRECVKLIAGKSNAASCKTIQKKYVDDIENQLIEKSVPYIAIPTGTGDVMFVVPKQYEMDLIKAQENVMFTTTDYVMSCSAANIAKSAKSMGYDNVMEFKFVNKDVADVAVQKLYQSGIPSGMIEHPDGTVTITAHPRCFYKEDGMDLLRFRLEMAFEASKGAKMFGGENSSYLQTRLDQAKYDTAQLREFAKSVKDGKSMVLGDTKGASNVFLETKNGEILLHTKGKDGQWLGKKLDVSKNATVKSIENLCSIYADKIYNKANISTTKWNSKFKDVTPDRNDPDVMKLQKQRPLFKKDDKNYILTAKNELDGLLDAVLTEANRRTKMEFKNVNPTNPKAMKKAAAYKEQCIADLLNDKTFIPVTKFLGNNGLLTKEEKETWLNEIKEIFMEEKEISTFSMEIQTQEITKKYIKDLEATSEKDFEFSETKEAPDRDVE